MKKYLIIISGIILFICSCTALVSINMVPARDIVIEATPERVARGNYLANNVTGCMSCHSGTDPSYFGRGLPIKGKEGAGGFHIKGKMGPMASVKGVIHSGLGLTVVLYLLLVFLICEKKEDDSVEDGVAVATLNAD